MGHEPETKIPENSKENLDRKLDHAIEETFPTSDPVSVTVTKGGAIDYDAQETTSPAASEGRIQEAAATVENLIDQATDTLRDVVGSASGLAREAYKESKPYVRRASEAYPQAERYYRDGSRVVAERVTESPLLSLLVAGAVGYALAWMIHGTLGSRDEHVPDYARTRRRYSESR
jgi:hypothetical protein